VTGTFKERKQPHRYQGYVALMSDIIYSKPYIYEEVAKE